MPLHLNTGGAVPHIRYMAQTSSWALSTEHGPQPFKLTEAIFDLANIRTGWGLFGEGVGPEWVLDSSLSQPAPKPADGRDWRRGFKVMVLLPRGISDEQLREFATTATGAVMGVDALYTEYEKEADNHPNQVPVVRFESATPVKVGKGNTTVPKLAIARWVDRPTALEAAHDASPQQPAPAPQPTPAAQPVQPPAEPQQTPAQPQQAPAQPQQPGAQAPQSADNLEEAVF